MLPRLVLMALSLVAVTVTIALAEDKPVRPDVPPRITIAKDITRITSPLRKDGYPDYVGALEAALREGMTPENNFTVELLAVVGPSEINEDVRDEYFRRLGSPVLPAEGDYYESFFDYLVRKADDVEDRQALSETFYTAQDRPWTAEQSPVVARWLDEQKKHLDRIVVASRRPRYYSPLVTNADDEVGMLISVMLPTISEVRELARALAVRAMLRAGKGDLDGAWEDVMACFRLGRLSSQGATLIDSLVGIAVDNLAWKGVVALAHSDRITAAQLMRFRADLAALPAPSPMVDKIDRGERYMFLDSICTLQRVGPNALSELTGADGEDRRLAELSRQATNALIDWDEVLRIGNHFYDRMVDAVRKDDAEAYDRLQTDVERIMRSAKTGLLGAPLLALGGPSGKKLVSRHMGGLLLALFMPALGTARAAEQRDAAQMQLADVALALAAYRIDHRGYPDALDALVPNHIAKVLDPFADAALRYRRTDGGYVLYSVGPDARDDRGSTREDDHPTDDITVRSPVAD